MPRRYVIPAIAATTLLAGALAFFVLPRPAFLSGHTSAFSFLSGQTPSPSPPNTSASSLPNASSPAAEAPYPSAPVPPLKRGQNPHFPPSNHAAHGSSPGAVSPDPGQAPAPASGPSVSPGTGAKGTADLIWSLAVKERAVFITIDDGWFPSQPLLQLMRQKHLPVTAFLIQQAAQEHPDYWRAFLAAGGTIENHTFSHPDLAKLPFQAVENQVQTAETYLSSLGPAPTLFRPPYGDYSTSVRQAVYQAGIKHVVMWDAVMSGDTVQTYNSQPLQPGSIILLHWDPGLSGEVHRLLDILYQNNLGVASLPQALANPNSFPVIWPQGKNPNLKVPNQAPKDSTAKPPSAPPSSSSPSSSSPSPSSSSPSPSSSSPSPSSSSPSPSSSSPSPSSSSPSPSSSSPSPSSSSPSPSSSSPSPSSSSPSPSSPPSFSPSSADAANGA